MESDYALLRRLRRILVGPIRRSPYGRLISAVAAHGPQFLRHLSWLNRSQWYSPERLRAWQESRLSDLILHAYVKCPYYHRAYEACDVSPGQIRGIDDLAGLPVLSREAIMKHRADLVASDARRYRPSRGWTSGTTGARLEFLRDRASASVATAALWRFLAWHGVHIGDRLAGIGTRFRPGQERETFIDHKPESRLMYLSVLGADPTRHEKIARALADFQPDVIRTGTPGWLTFLSLYLQEHPEYVIRPKVISSSGERLFPEQRRIIAAAFGAQVVDYYANMESAVSGGECENGRLHISAEMGIVEILRNGRPCPPGEEGDIVITNLWNRSFPLIRYAIGDVGLIEPDPCRCGRGLPTWKVVGGRERDFLATPTGYIYPDAELAFTPAWSGKIAGLRLYQETRTAVVAQIIKAPGFTDADVPKLEADLTALLGGQLHVTVQFVDTLERTFGGKFRYVVSKVPLRT